MADIFYWYESISVIFRSSNVEKRIEITFSCIILKTRKSIGTCGANKLG